MIADLLSIQFLAVSFLIVIALLWLVFELSSNPPRKQKKEKSRIFACGMEASPEELNVPSDSYYEYMKRFLRTGYLARLHSGRLSSYVVWIIIGTALIMAVMLIW